VKSIVLSIISKMVKRKVSLALDDSAGIVVGGYHEPTLRYHIICTILAIFIRDDALFT